ncbi:MAG TPA: hypothetical protein ENH23_07885 [candidate division Zixibacteria bacterium]|nr:hypothetical protein [candidate division Zixibacteria bacterium]
MSNEFMLLLVGLGVGVLVCAFLLLKIIVEVKKARKEFAKIHEEQIRQFHKEFMAKRNNNNDED